MDSFPLKIPEVIGIGFVAVVALWIIWQIVKMIINDKNKTIDRVLDAMQKNTHVMENVERSTTINTEATKASADIVKASAESIKTSADSMGRTADRFTQALLTMMQGSISKKE